jgi:hypothetical protein
MGKWRVFCRKLPQISCLRLLPSHGQAGSYRFVRRVGPDKRPWQRRFSDKSTRNGVRDALPTSHY